MIVTADSGVVVVSPKADGRDADEDAERRTAPTSTR